MNEYYKIYQEHKKEGRGPAFQYVLDTFAGSIDILEIGTLNSLNPSECGGAGWSTFWWCDYIKDNGGKLVIVDNREIAIENCKIALEDFVGEIDIEFNLGDGKDFVSDEYDFIYLDGSDHAEEMVDQFNKINRNKTSVLCDDFSQKGAQLIEENEMIKKEFDSEKDFGNDGLITKSFGNMTLLSIFNGVDPQDKYIKGHPLAFYHKIKND